MYKFIEMAGELVNEKSFYSEENDMANRLIKSMEYIATCKVIDYTITLEYVKNSMYWLTINYITPSNISYKVLAYVSLDDIKTAASIEYFEREISLSNYE